MGARHSKSTTRCEADESSSSLGATATGSSALEPGGNVDESTMPHGDIKTVVPLRPPMPVIARPETFEEKLYRKFKAEPLVPIGCLTTAYFLGSGIKSFYNRDPAKSQKMMRLRVGAQFATILIFMGYAGMNSFTFEFAPGMASPSDQGFDGKKGDEDE